MPRDPLLKFPSFLPMSGYGTGSRIYTVLSWVDEAQSDLNVLSLPTTRYSTSLVALEEIYRLSLRYLRFTLPALSHSWTDSSMAQNKKSISRLDKGDEG
jgi:hypothetical protein